MQIFTEVIGNLAVDPAWKDKANGLNLEFVDLDQWTAQKSRFYAKSDKGNEYAVALKRHTQIIDGDILFYSEPDKHAVVARIELSPVMVVNLGSLLNESSTSLIQRCIELGHAIGNQHWPAVVKGTKVYIPLTVDKKVMLSVMDTHHIEGITYEFQPGVEVIPYLAPHEIRRLFGGTEPGSHSHEGEQHLHTHKH